MTEATSTKEEQGQKQLLSEVHSAIDNFTRTQIKTCLHLKLTRTLVKDVNKTLRSGVIVLPIHAVRNVRSNSKEGKLFYV